MGSGIAETAAVNGFDVVLRSRSQSTADATLATMEKSLNRQVDKGKKTEAERDEALARVTVTTALAALKDVDLVIESVVEDLDVKKELFNELDRITADHTILATNTSTLPGHRVGHADRPARKGVRCPLLQPGTGDGAGGGGQTPDRGRRDRAGGPGSSPRPAARPRSRSRTRPGSS